MKDKSAWAGCLPAVLLILVLTGCATTPTLPSPTATATQRPAEVFATQAISAEPTVRPAGGKVSVGDHELYLRCTGEASPTVIIEPDFLAAGTNSNWGQVTEEVGLATRVCLYDRANVGRSDHVDGARTSEDIAADLHNLLESAEIEAPYILVGHAIGSWHARVFAQQHPDEVAGMVLVSPAHPDFFDRLLGLLPAASESEDEAIAGIRAFWSDPGSFFADSDEHFDYVTSAEQVRNSGPFGDMPIIIISEDPAILDGETELPPDVYMGIVHTREELEAEQLSLSENSEQRIAEGAQYTVHTENPQVIVDAVLSLVEGAR